MKTTAYKPSVVSTTMASFLEGRLFLETTEKFTFFFSSLNIPLVIEPFISLQESASPLRSDDQMPLYVLSIQERAEQLAFQFEGKPVAPQVKFPTVDMHR